MIDCEKCTDDNKCILHCEKDTWFDLIEEKKDWTKSEENIKYFWSEIRKYILNTLKDEKYKVEQYYIDLTNVIFPKFEEPYADTYEESCDDWYHDFCDEIITNSKFPSNDLKRISGFNFSNSIFLDVVDFTDYQFEGLVFNNTIFTEECKFSNSKINSIFFQKTIFYKSTLFENSTINFHSYQSKDFENCEFHDKLIFDNIIFNENKSKTLDLDFKNTKFKELNISNTTFEKGFRFYKESNIEYLDIKNCKIRNLFIAAKVPIIDLDSNKKEIDRFVIKPNNLKSLTISNSLINKDFLLNDEENNSKSNLDFFNLKESTFKGKVKIQFYDCIGDANFYNTKFEDLADFSETKFYKVNFEETDFKNIAVFIEAEFYCDVDFKYTKFLGTSIFRDTVITGKLNLRDTIFKENANFLDITSKSRKIYDEEKKDFIHIGELEDIEVSNRETARIIKNFFDSSNNIIEANRFYKLEMKQREKELDFKKSFSEWITFKIHSISSNHSQDWLLAIFWIISITFLYSYSNFLLNNNKTEIVLLPFIISFLVVFLIF
ncbi:MAG: pentapeptide repeat-containing protein [Candidatus Paceibacteria bacterium]